MEKKLIAAGIIGLPLAWALTGCSASPLEAGIQKCQDSLQYEIEQVTPEPSAGWVDSELKSQITSTDSENDYVHDVTGTATVKLADGNEVTVEWDCFTQTADGTTYATVQHIDGECSLTYREARPDDC